jgi:hypothetical protein
MGVALHHVVEPDVGGDVPLGPLVAVGLALRSPGRAEHGGEVGDQSAVLAAAVVIAASAVIEEVEVGALDQDGEPGANVDQVDAELAELERGQGPEARLVVERGDLDGRRTLWLGRLVVG